jgi:creatinine amidohydrolase/Fe(II)-dependent formamide hydrolase-like protein
VERDDLGGDRRSRRSDHRHPSRGRDRAAWAAFAGGTDSFIPAGILEALLQRHEATQAMALPLQPIGWSHEHGDLPGTPSLDAEFLAIGWVALGASVASAGQ